MTKQFPVKDFFHQINYTYKTKTSITTLQILDAPVDQGIEHPIKPESSQEPMEYVHKESKMTSEIGTLPRR